MTTDEKDRVVLRRGMVEHDWYESGSAAAPEAVGKPAARPSPRLSYLTLPRIVGAIGVAVVVVVMFGAFLAFSFHGFHAEGKSMEPGLKDGDRLVVARIPFEEIDFGLLNWLPSYDSSDLRWGSPERGDVIVFESPVRDERLVKRVIGLPGDRIRIENGDVYVNGGRLDEPYAKGTTDCLKTCAALVVPAERYFVLGDNREDSVDSRQGWTVSREDISGKVIVSF
ncbi:MAG: signal peptidase I [Dehalococcoidia bacterium]